MVDEKPYDAGDEKQVKKRKTRKRRQLLREESDIRTVLATREGRNVLWRILGKCYIYDDILPGEFERRQLGARAVGLEFLAELLTVDPKVYMVMQSENDTDESKE